MVIVLSAASTAFTTPGTFLYEENDSALTTLDNVVINSKEKTTADFEANDFAMIKPSGSKINQNV